jgi:hypothetical protein
MVEVYVFIAIALVGAGAVLGAVVTMSLGFCRDDRPASAGIQDSLPIELTGSPEADPEAYTPAARITISLLPSDPPEEECSAAAHLVIVLLPDPPADASPDQPSDGCG